MRYIRGWLAWFEIVRQMRTKRHGAGKQPWLYCFRGGACARYLVDGQHRGSRGPRYLRRKQ